MSRDQLEDRVAELLRERDALRAEVTTLRQQLAEREAWEVVEDGTYGTHDTIAVSHSARFLDINSAYGDGSRRHQAMILLPDDMRLMRRKEADDGDA